VHPKGRETEADQETWGYKGPEGAVWSQHGNGALKKLQTELEGEPLQSPQAPQRIEKVTKMSHA